MRIVALVAGLMVVEGTLKFDRAITAMLSKPLPDY